MSKAFKLEVPNTRANYDKDMVIGKELYENLYANIGVFGRKGSGKTIVLYNTLKACCGKNTSVIMFGPTVEKDPIYESIREMLDKKNTKHISFSNIIDDETSEDLLNGFIKRVGEIGNFAQEAEAENEINDVIPETKYDKMIPKEECKVLFGGELTRKQIEELKEAEMKKIEEAPKKRIKRKGGKRKKPNLAPDFILCFDDMGPDLAKKAITKLLLKNRHYKIKTIILSQWLKYLAPSARRQLDYVVLFPGFSHDSLKDLHSELDLSDEIDHFINVYKEVTDKPHSFLVIDISRNRYRRGFEEYVN